MARGKNYNTYNWTTARYAGAATCGHTIMVGDMITFRPMDRTTLCNACAHKRAAQIRDERRRDAERQPQLPGLT